MALMVHVWGSDTVYYLTSCIRVCSAAALWLKKPSQLSRPWRRMECWPLIWSKTSGAVGQLMSWIMWSEPYLIALHLHLNFKEHMNMSLNSLCHLAPLWSSSTLPTKKAVNWPRLAKPKPLDLKEPLFHWWTPQSHWSWGHGSNLILQVRLEHVTWEPLVFPVWTEAQSW